MTTRSRSPLRSTMRNIPALFVAHRFRGLVRQQLDVAQHARQRAAESSRDLRQEFVLGPVEHAQSLDHLVAQPEGQRT